MSKSLKEYVSSYKSILKEEEDKSAQKEADEKLKSAIKWDMWESPSVKTNWLKDNFSYNKIQFVYRDTDKGIEVCFLMGYTKNDNEYDNRDGELPYSWKIWVGKVGAISYGEDWSWNLKTDDLSEAIMKSLDVICSFIREIESDKTNYVAYYVHI